MKPMGPIPPWFEGEDGMLLIGGCGAASLIEEAGDTPLFAVATVTSTAAAVSTLPSARGSRPASRSAAWNSTSAGNPS